MQEISKLPVYTGTIPNKAAQSDNEFANNIFGFINYSGNVFVGNFNTIIGQFNVLKEEINTAASEVSNNKTFVSNAKIYIEETIAILPNGTINNTTPGDDKTYSSNKINTLLDEKANTADIYNKTELDLKISYQQFDKPTSDTLFIKVSPSSIKIPAGLKLTVGTTSFKVVSDYTLTLASNLVGSTKTAGTDYFVYAKSNATFYISASDAITADRLIGGFHYGLVGETEALTGNKSEAWMVEQRGIWSHSCWDIKFRPTANVRGKNYANGLWVDIYLADEDIAIRGYSSPWKSAGVKAKIAGGAVDANGRAIPKIPLAFGGNGTLTYGKFTQFQAAEIAAALKMRLLKYSEFPSLAYGVTEQVSSSTNGYETTVGAIEHYPHLTSRYMEQATGTQYIWGDDLMNGYGSTDFAWRSGLTDTRGNIYATSNSPTAVTLGGNRGDGVVAGSRSSYWGSYVWSSGWSGGCRFACDHLELV